nr:putative rna-binding protein c25g10.01 [Quercus suber]
MADMDTYDAEPRQYEGMYIYIPHQLCTLLWLIDNVPSRRRCIIDSLVADNSANAKNLQMTAMISTHAIVLALQLLPTVTGTPDCATNPPMDAMSGKLVKVCFVNYNDPDFRPSGPPPERRGGGGNADEDDESVNPGSNLFVTGIHPRLSEEEVTRLFEKYGVVEKCNIMRDPHTRESRGFGFVKMMTPEEADAAKEGLQGVQNEGRTLSIEKARRARPRTPTPGKYFGPPKRGPPSPYPYDPYYDAPRRGGGYRDRFDDRGYGRRDDRRGGGGGYRDRYDDRGYGRRDDYVPRGERGGDRYGGGREDRYGGDRRGGGYGGGSYDRAPRGPPPESSGYSGDGPPPRDGAASRSYDDRPRRYD